MRGANYSHSIKKKVDVKSFTKIPHDPFSLTLRACIAFLSSTLPISFSSWFPTFYPVCSFQVLFLFVHIILFFCLCSYARLNFYETPKRFHIDLSTWCIMMPQFKSPSMLSNNVKINIYVCMMYVYVNLTNLQHKLDMFFIAILMHMLGLPNNMGMALIEKFNEAICTHAIFKAGTKSVGSSGLRIIKKGDLN